MENYDKFLIVNEQISVPLTEIQFEFVRSSGPGGQNVNKVNSQAQLHWHIAANETLPADVKQRLSKNEGKRINKFGVLRIDCQTSRDREKNRLECLNRLRQMIVNASQVPTVRKKRKLPWWVKEKRLKKKKEKSNTKRLRRPPTLEQ